MENLIYGIIYSTLFVCCLILLYYTFIKPFIYSPNTNWIYEDKETFLKYVRYSIVLVWLVSLYGVISAYSPKFKIMNKHVDKNQVTRYNDEVIEFKLKPVSPKISRVDKMKMLREDIEKNVEK